MVIDLDAFFGPTATRAVEDLANEPGNKVAYIKCWDYFGEFPGFDFLRHCGEITHINMIFHPERPATIDFSSVPVPDTVEHVHVRGGNIRRHGGYKYSEKISVVRGLNHLSNLKNLRLSDFHTLHFGDTFLPPSLEKMEIFNPGKCDTSSIPTTSVGWAHLLGFDQNKIRNYDFISRFTGLKILWMNYCNGLEIFPPFHPDAPVREVLFAKARRLKNVEAFLEKKGIETLGFRFCPLLTIEELRCLQQLPKLKEFYVSHRKQEEEVRSLFPNINITLDRLLSG